MYECQPCGIFEMGVFQPARKCPECGTYFEYIEMIREEEECQSQNRSKIG
ncbi:zinc ribbon domain protein [Bacillus phage 035JT001]|nr:zinc ribbon domain protein [Bacillus phage 035JT001]